MKSICPKPKLSYWSASLIRYCTVVSTQKGQKEWLGLHSVLKLEKCVMCTSGCTIISYIGQNRSFLKFFFIPEVILGSLRSKKISKNVECNFPKLHFFRFLTYCDLVGRSSLCMSLVVTG